VSRASAWAEFPVTYRQEQVQTILNWLRVGESGVVVGMSGAGKSNLLGFLASRPDAAYGCLGDSVADNCLLFLDVNRLPSLTGTAFYRAMLQALHESKNCLPEPFQQQVGDVYRQNIDSQDDLILFGALEDMHSLFCHTGGKRVTWLLDRFDEAARSLDVQFLSSLRALRDACKVQLCYVVATRYPLPDLRDPNEIDEFYEILASNVCWVGPMVERDARWVASQMAERCHAEFAEGDVVRILSLTGRLPAFLKIVFTLLAGGVLQAGDKVEAWQERLLGRPDIQRQCRQLRNDLTDAQWGALLGVMAGLPLDSIEQATLEYIQNVGLVVREEACLRVFSPLFEAFLRNQRGTSRGRILLHPETRTVWRGDMQLPKRLTEKEDLLLSYFLEHVHGLCTKDDLVRAVWPEDVQAAGIQDDRLAQLIRRLREKIEFNPSKPNYIVTEHGRGYRFVQPDD
jgi:DNA-binding winged helix-turn-helix (wHTH) protein